MGIGSLMLGKICIAMLIYVCVAIGIKKCCATVFKTADQLFYIELAVVFIAVYIFLMFSVYRAFGDIRDFSQMMVRLTEEGFYGCYEKGGIIYPPVSQYYFWLIAKVLIFCGIPIDAELVVVTFSVKLPCIVCVFLMAWLVNWEAKKYIQHKERVLLLYLVLLNPGFIFATGYVCQVDAIYTLLIVLVIWLLIKEKRRWAYFVFGISVLFKFQTVFITPVIIFSILDQVFFTQFTWKKFWGDLVAGVGAIGLMILSYVPFVYNFQNGEFSHGGFTTNFSQTIAGFGKASQNAYNFWTLVGFNQVWQTEKFGLLSCQTWGTIFIVLLVATTSFFYMKKTISKDLYPMLAALLVSGMYCFAVRMMSRYLYPAVILLFLGYAVKPTKRRLNCSVLMAIAFYIETSVEYLVYPWRTYSTELVIPYIISAFCIGCFGYLIYTIWSEIKDDRFKLV